MEFMCSSDLRKACLADVSSEAHNVEPGLAGTLAMAGCPGLLLQPRAPNAEAETNRLLLATAVTLSPRVERPAEGDCTVDLQGADSVQTEIRMRACIDDLTHGGIAARIGAAATPLLAAYAASCARPILVIGDPREFLAQLPLDFAEPTAIQANVLRGWGITTLGQLTSLAKAEIAERLGTDGVLLWERAAGETTRVL